jgi:hypothetical protein
MLPLTMLPVAVTPPVAGAPPVAAAPPVPGAPPLLPASGTGSPASVGAGNAQTPSLVQTPDEQSLSFLQSGRQTASLGLNVKQRVPVPQLPFVTYVDAGSHVSRHKPMRPPVVAQLVPVGHAPSHSPFGVPFGFVPGTGPLHPIVDAAF